jgi:hypothetical protein
MKNTRIHMFAKLWLSTRLVVALITWMGIAGVTHILDEQLIQAAGHEDLVLVKTLMAKGASQIPADSDMCPGVDKE